MRGPARALATRPPRRPWRRTSCVALYIHPGRRRNRRRRHSPVWAASPRRPVCPHSRRRGACSQAHHFVSACLSLPRSLAPRFLSCDGGALVLCYLLFFKDGRKPFLRCNLYVRRHKATKRAASSWLGFPRAPETGGRAVRPASGRELCCVTALKGGTLLALSPGRRTTWRGKTVLLGGGRFSRFCLCVPVRHFKLFVSANHEPLVSVIDKLSS